MPTMQRSIRLPEEAVQDIENLAGTIGRDFSGLARDILLEAVKMRKCPGIVFTDGAACKDCRHR